MIEIDVSLCARRCCHGLQATDATSSGWAWWTSHVTSQPPPASHAADDPLHDPSSYGDAFADVYDQWYSTLEDDDFIQVLARQLPKRSARILELGVGTGRLVEKLRTVRPEHGDQIVGIDASEKMLAIAHDRGIHNVAQLVCGDFSQALPSGPFDAVFVGYNTLFNLPSETAIASCLSHVAKVLSPTGFFLTDLVIPNNTEEMEHSSLRTMPNGDVIKSVSYLNPTLRTISGYFAHLLDGVETKKRPWRVHFVMPHQLDELANRAGLVLAERTADGNGTVFTADSSRHISRYILR